MKAAYINAYGPPSNLIVGDIPDPVPGAGDILVSTVCASINPADCKVRDGSSQTAGDVSFPQVLGRDFSGVVAELGDGVTDFEPGDEVFAVLDRGVEAAYAEKIVLPASLAAAKPAGLSHQEAAALALTGLTALIALEETLDLQSGQKILIQGGAGGVGSFAVQLAHHIGAHVVTTASPRNHDYLKELGADEIIDYNSVDFAEVVSDCDAVFDTVGGEVQLRSYACLKPGGKLAWVSPAPAGSTPPRDDVTSSRPNVARDRPHLERIVDLWEKGAIKPPEIEEMPLSDIVKAHELSEAHHVRGKIVLMIG